MKKFWESEGPWPGGKGWPSYYRTEYVRYGFYVLRIARPDYAGFSVFLKYLDYAAADLSKVLCDWDDYLPVQSWKAWKGREARMDNALRKALEKLRGSNKLHQTKDAALEAKCPLLHGMLTETESLEKGKHRETSTLWIVASEGGFRCCLGDRDSGGSLWANAETLEGLWDALEKRLASPSPDWRFNDGNRKFAKQKRKGG